MFYTLARKYKKQNYPFLRISLTADVFTRLGAE